MKMKLINTKFKLEITLISLKWSGFNCSCRHDDPYISRKLKVHGNKCWRIDWIGELIDYNFYVVMN